MAEELFRQIQEQQGERRRMLESGEIRLPAERPALTVRKIEPEDLPKLEACAEAFADATRFAGEFNFEHFLEVWTIFLRDDFGTIFVLETEDGEVLGALGGVVFPDIYSGARVATEFFFFVQEAHRSGGAGLKLYHAFEDWTRAQGCSQIRMVALADSMPELVGALYRRLGFEVMETTYRKEL